MGENWCFIWHIHVFIWCLFSFAFTLFFSETGEAFLEEYPNNKRDQKTLEELILKRVQLGTKILEDGWSSYEHFQELSCVVFVCCRMTLMLTSHWDFINHSENFRKPEDDSVHTNTIEGLLLFWLFDVVMCKSGRWFVVKRTLPRSGAFDLAR